MSHWFRFGFDLNRLGFWFSIRLQSNMPRWDRLGSISWTVYLAAQFSFARLANRFSPSSRISGLVTDIARAAALATVVGPPLLTVFFRFFRANLPEQFVDAEKQWRC